MTHSHHSLARHSRHGATIYLYEEPETICYCGNVPCICPPDVGAITESDLATVYPGFNVWDVWQVNDLPFSIMMIGVDRDRQLRIWVEDSLRLAGVQVADSIDLKGGQIEILNGSPPGLSVDMRKEQVPGPSMVVSGPATLRTVRFFNRGKRTSVPWPHDESYLLEKTYVPSPTNPATSGDAPPTIAGGVASGVIAPIKDVLGEIPPAVYIGGAIGLGLYLFRKELFSGVKRIRKF